MNTSILTLDPDLMQAVTPTALANSTAKTPAQMRDLRAKRNAAIKADQTTDTREQRRRDVTIKMLKPNEDALFKLRKLDIGNYFCVPYDMAKSVRSMIFRELSIHPDKCYVTSKFKWGQHFYLKVKRVPEH